MSERVTREEAKEIIDENPYGAIIVSETEPVPTIGEVDVEDMKFTVNVNRYQFGSEEELAEEISDE